MAILVQMQDPVTGEGVSDSFPNKENAVDFLTAQLLLWKINRGKMSQAGFRVQVRDIG